MRLKILLILLISTFLSSSLLLAGSHYKKDVVDTAVEAGSLLGKKQKFSRETLEDMQFVAVDVAFALRGGKKHWKTV